MINCLNSNDKLVSFTNISLLKCYNNVILKSCNISDKIQ